MTDRIASTLIVVPDWGIWAVIVMWSISTVLTIIQMVLRYVTSPTGSTEKA